MRRTYRVLYRKWRPQVFSDVVGQPQVTVTLASQVRENRLAHAYLFTGSRGTGKTTCAKILSKAVNCLHPVNGDPCNECEICRGIDNGTVLDVVEIDAASNRGIDDIRLLRDEASFTPARAKYRVYIIDEVHMLTIEAFNALLKTLEEPPAHVKFVLATTEVHKLPATILSRCQRFDFRRIEPKIIADRLRQVAGAEGAALEPDAAMLIARIADGGMRDALSLLDRAMSVEEHVTASVVSACAGLMGRSQIYDLCRAAADRDAAKCLILLDELHKASCDTERLVTELTEQFRNFLILKSVKAPENLIVCTDEELEILRGLAASFTKEEILYALRVLTEAADAMRRTQNRRVEAEMALIRLCHPASDADASALAARVSALERTVERLLQGGAPVPAARPAPVRTPAAPAEDPPFGPDVPFPTDAPAEDPPFEPDVPFPTDAPTEDPPFGPDVPFPTDAPAEDPPFGPDVPFPTDAPAEDPPFEPDVPLPTDAPAEDLPFDAAPPAEKPAFAGFAADVGGGYARKFAAADGDAEGDDEPFDFDAFMKKHGGEKQAASDGRPEPAAAPAKENAGAAEELDERTWVRIILDTERSFAPLVGQLTNSHAYLRGGALVIRPVSRAMRLMLREDILSKYLGPVAKRILGKEYQIRIED